LSATTRRAADDLKFVILGNKGGPRVVKGYTNPSGLILADGKAYLIDCGYGVTRQLAVYGLPAQQVRDILITHNHSDHVLELGPLIYNAWAAGLRDPVTVWGPPPVKQIVGDFLRSMTFDIDIRIVDEGRPDLRKLVTVNEIDAPGPVLQSGDLKVTATKVRHPPLTHAYAYRFDTPSRSIVLSGDTTYSPELVEFARNADLLVHEVMSLEGVDRLLVRNPNASTLRSHLLASHSTPEQVGQVAAEAHVKGVVLYHLVPGDDPSITDEMFAGGVRKAFSGPVTVGHELQSY
jgi:ribonuclease BN (tRNA processing enzyme)